MANVNWTKGLARLNAWHAGPRFGGLTKPFQEITNDPPIVAVNQFPISDLSPADSDEVAPQHRDDVAP